MKKYMLQETTCKRCGRKITTMTNAVNTSESTRVKWSGICGRCITDTERFEMMLDMNADIKSRIEAQR